MNLPLEEITYHQSSFFDVNGRLFRWRDGLYRGILPRQAALYRRMFEEGTIDRLIRGNLLVETELTPLKLDGYELVLRHQVLPFESYACEWCPAMLKDAALRTMDLEIELSRQGLMLRDAHPGNILFGLSADKGPHPVFVDFGSIEPAIPGYLWPARHEFARYFLNPLILMSQGLGHLARPVMLNPYAGISESDRAIVTHDGQTSLTLRKLARTAVTKTEKLLPAQTAGALHRGFIRLRGHAMRAAPSPQPALLENLRHQVEEIPTPSSHGRNLAHANTDSGEMSVIRRILDQRKPATLLILGNRDAQSVQLASEMAQPLGGQSSNVVVIDGDEAEITRLYEEAGRAHQRLLPILMDFTRPTPRYGLGGHCADAATARLRCQGVLALDLVPRLTVTECMTFEQIGEGLGAFARQWALVKYTAPDPQKLPYWWTRDLSSHTLANFIGALRRHFSKVEPLAGASQTCALLLCEKEQNWN